MLYSNDTYYISICNNANSKPSKFSKSFKQPHSIKIVKGLL